jgi:hypothetical protein
LVGPLTAPVRSKKPAREAADLLPAFGGRHNLIGHTITKSVMLNSHFYFLSDENLLRISPGRGHIPTVWEES